MASPTVHRPMVLVGSGIFSSRVLGLARDLVLASVWGTGTAMGGWVFAFTIPNLLRALFAEGAFSAAFVPVFSERLETDGEQRAWHSATAVISALLLAVALVSASLAGIAVVLGTLSWEGTMKTAFRLLPLVMPYAVLIAGSTAFAGVLNAMGHFTLPAFSPILLNGFLIVAALGCAPLFGETRAEWIFALPWAALAAGTVQLFLHGLQCRHLGFRWRFRFERRHADTRRVAALMAPVMVGTGVMQLNVLVDRTLAAWLGSEAITSLYYSQRLVYLPVSLFGVALGVASLPLLSRAWAAGNRSEMQKHLQTGLEQVFFLSVPAALGLFAVRAPAVALLFERGAFSARDTAETVWALLFYLPGIPAFACAKVATTPFHAAHDTRTPVRIAAVCLAVNVVLNLSLMPFLEQGGLALATTISSWLNVTLLLRTARGTVGTRWVRPLAAKLLRFAAAGCISLAVALMIAWWTVRWGGGNPTTLGARLVQTVVPLTAFCIVYLGTTRFLGCREAEDLWHAIRTRTRH